MKSHFSKVAACSLLLVIFLGCAKKKNVAATSGGGTTTVATGDPGGTYDGAFFCSSIRLFPSTFTGNLSAAFFSTAQPVIGSYLSIAGTATVSSVLIGTITCSYYAAQNNYFGPTLTFSPATWNVNGAGTVPTFSYTNNDAIPNYGDAFSLPQTINKNQNLTIPVTSLSGADQITFELVDASNVKTSVSRAIPVSSVVFLKDSLLKLASGNGTLNVYATKYNPQAISGKNFLFVNCSKTAINSITIQ